jgi:hypothetical protein
MTGFFLPRLLPQLWLQANGPQHCIKGTKKRWVFERLDFLSGFRIATIPGNLQPSD